MGESRVLNPVDIEAGILAASNEVAKGVDEWSKAHQAFLAAEEAFDLKWARCYMSSSGPVEERKQHCTIETAEEKHALNQATVLYKYVDRRLKAAESRLSAYQTLSKSVTAAYQSAGRGEY